MSNRTKGNLALLLTAAMWGSGFISQKLGNEVMPPMTFNAVRQLLAAMLLTPFMIRSLKKAATCRGHRIQARSLNTGRKS